MCHPFIVKSPPLRPEGCRSCLMLLGWGSATSLRHTFSIVRFGCTRSIHRTTEVALQLCIKLCIAGLLRSAGLGYHKRIAGREIAILPGCKKLMTGFPYADCYAIIYVSNFVSEKTPHQRGFTLFKTKENGQSTRPRSQKPSPRSTSGGWALSTLNSKGGNSGRTQRATLNWNNCS